MSVTGVVSFAEKNRHVPSQNAILNVQTTSGVQDAMAWQNVSACANLQSLITLHSTYITRFGHVTRSIISIVLFIMFKLLTTWLVGCWNRYTCGTGKKSVLFQCHPHDTRNAGTIVILWTLPNYDERLLLLDICHKVFHVFLSFRPTRIHQIYVSNGRE